MTPNPERQKVEQIVKGLSTVIPEAAKFNVGIYPDGSGPVAQVSYDTEGSTYAGRLWIETSSDNWIAVDQEYAEALCSAIITAALAVRSLIQEGGK